MLQYFFHYLFIEMKFVNYLVRLWLNLNSLNIPSKLVSSFRCIPSCDCLFQKSKNIWVHLLIHTFFYPSKMVLFYLLLPCIIRIGELKFLIFLSLSYLSLSKNLIGKYGYTFFAASTMDVNGDSSITPANLWF